MLSNPKMDVVQDASDVEISTLSDVETEIDADTVEPTGRVVCDGGGNDARREGEGMPDDGRESMHCMVESRGEDPGAVLDAFTKTEATLVNTTWSDGSSGDLFRSLDTLERLVGSVLSLLEEPDSVELSSHDDTLHKHVEEMRGERSLGRLMVARCFLNSQLDSIVHQRSPSQIPAGVPLVVARYRGVVGVGDSHGSVKIYVPGGPSRYIMKYKLCQIVD